MTQLLLDDKCGIVLNSEEEAVLIEIMACAVRRAVGVTPPAGRSKGKVTNLLYSSNIIYSTLFRFVLYYHF